MAAFSQSEQPVPAGTGAAFGRFDSEIEPNQDRFRQMVELHLT